MTTRSNIKTVNGKKQSFYVSTGRIEVRKLARVIESHIDNKNIKSALKAINEYKKSARYLYAQHMDRVDEWLDKIKKISDSESKIDQYKKDLMQD